MSNNKSLFSILIGVCGNVISLPKTIYFNFMALPFHEAIKMPILLSHSVRILKVKKGVISFPNGVHPFMVRIGKGGTKQVMSYSFSQVYIGGGKLVFKGRAGFSKGVSLDCTGDLSFGSGFSCNKNTFISCDKQISFGDNVVLGDNIVIRDNDGHTVTYNNKAKLSKRPIIIGNHVWIAFYAHILKGSIIADESIVAYRSLVVGKFTEPRSLIAGIPAKVIQTNIGWGNLNETKELKDNCSGEVLHN